MRQKVKIFLLFVALALTGGCATEPKCQSFVPSRPFEQGALESPSESRSALLLSGYVVDARCTFGSRAGLANATISYDGTTATTDAEGHFELTLNPNGQDPLLEIRAPGYLPYRELASRMIEGSFHLIPKDLFRGVYLVLWNREKSNPANWHRKWEQQTEFLILRTGASQLQIRTVLSLLESDEYKKLTGGRFTSKGKARIVDRKPSGSDKEGKTVISFAPGIVRGGIAHSNDRNGVIYYAEIKWNTNEVIGPKPFWHEMFHTVTAGGHINEWPSVVSEVATTGYVTRTDEQILNCIYNSPPLRLEPVY